MIGRSTPQLARVLRRERRRLAGVLSLAGLSAAFAAAGAVFLMGLSGWVVGSAAGGGETLLAIGAQAFAPSLAIRLLAVTRTVGRYGERVWSHAAALAALARLRPAVFAGLASSPAADALAVSAGEASARLVQDVDAIESLFVRRSNPWAFAAAAFSAMAVTWLAGAVSLGVLTAAVLASVLGGRLIRRRLLKPAAQIQDALGELKDAFVSLAQATPELRCYGLEDWAAQAIDTKGERVAALRVRRLAAEGAASFYQGAVSAVAISLIILAAGHVSIGVAGLATLAVLSALETVAGLVRTAEQDGAVRQAALRLEPLMRPQRRSFGERPSPAAPDLTIGEFTARAGLRLALAGPSGIGKTTLLDQLVGLRPSTEGRIGVGEVDIVDLDLQALRATFAYAPQEVQLITGSVRDNLLLADGTANDGDLWAVLHDAGLDDRIRANAAGLDHWIGDDGQRLSGGERRRLALARALLRPAPWLLLDEPTEGLDRRTEALVIQRLQRRLSRTGQGLVLVSHRPAALALADYRLQFDKAASSLVLEGGPSRPLPTPLGLQVSKPPFAEASC